MSPFPLRFLYLDDAFVYARLERANGLIRRRRECGAGSQTESRTVPRADDDIAVERTTGELTAVVRASVFDRVERAVDIEHGDKCAVDFDLRVVAVCDRFARCNPQPAHSEHPGLQSRRI